MHVADSHQSRDVGFVRLRGQGVAEEEHGANVTFSDSSANHEVAAIGAVHDSFDVESEFFCQSFARLSGRDELLRAEEVDVSSDEVQHLGLASVVSNESDHGDVLWWRRGVA